MVSAISGSTATALVASSGSTSSSNSVSEIEAQIARKEAELSAATDETEKQTIRSEIEALEGRLEQLRTAGSTAAEEAMQAENKLVGESERIGTRNFDEETEFGERTIYV
ncbi:hypothetical protein NGR_c34730 [Sinorhizobium fredii NGR234]|uniref:Uncharacterized protein n=1 Tax=Sinorhizobium fredii (strain NBRC 101917 / NGR234) TaxID=394 RepID=C3MBX2_SINFN|nr:hypothetical protein [Sinorhizobium fredii]ACP27197.1 hypothetical protein NGR_c34730 [Sinorhizobium fredii NGR234]